jgi:hypothetical protein
MGTQKRIRARSSYTAHTLLKSHDKGIIKAVARDVSIDSIYLNCDPVFEPGEQVNVEIILLGSDSELNIKMPAKVIRTDSDGIALSFFKPLEWWPVFSLFPLHQLGKESMNGRMPVAEFA